MTGDGNKSEQSFDRRVEVVRSSGQRRRPCAARRSLRAGAHPRIQKVSLMRILPIVVLSSSLAMGGANFALAQDQAGPGADSNAPQNSAVKSPNDIAHAPLAKGHNSFTKAEARARIRKAGYSDVKNLMLDSDGLWQAAAMQNGQTAHVALDYKGDVAAQ